MTAELLSTSAVTPTADRVHQLELLTHLDEALNLLLIGPPGAGVAALAQETLEQLYARAQEDEMSDPGWRACQWSNLSQYMEANWLNAPIVWERISLRPEVGYESLIRRREAPQVSAGGRGQRDEGLGTSPRDGLLVELALLAQRREAKVARREHDRVGPTILWIDGVDRGDLADALGEAVELLGVDARSCELTGAEGTRLRLCLPAAPGVIENSTLSVPRSLLLITTASDERSLSQTPARLWAHFRQVEVLPDVAALLAAYTDAPARVARGARALFDAVFARCPDPLRGVGHELFVVPAQEDWHWRLARRMIHEVLPALRRRREEGALAPDDAGVLRLERGVDVLELSYGSRRLQRAQAEALASWLARGL